jgi:hypothetical protein
VTTTISPALGHGPLTQQGTGATTGYDAIDARRWMDDPDLGEGVTTYGSFRVSQRAAGANLSVDINMDDFAYIRGEAVSLQGTYKAPPHASTINEPIAAADATNPRIDRVILELKDSTHDASGSNLFQTRVITGTPTGGASLDNLTGAGAVPSSAILLADVLVAATDTAISNAEMRDRRAFVAGIPPLLTAVDMVAFSPVPPASTLGPQNQVPSADGTLHDLHQAAVLVTLPRRIVGATRIRWRYTQHSTTALTGTYVLGIYDASGRKVIDTGAVAYTGATTAFLSRSETIAATTLEAGMYYVLFGHDGTSAGAVYYPGVNLEVLNLEAACQVFAPNTAVRSATGGTTAPATILGFTDVYGITSSTNIPAVPLISLSVG